MGSTSGNSGSCIQHGNHGSAPQALLMQLKYIPLGQVLDKGLPELQSKYFVQFFESEMLILSIGHVGLIAIVVEVTVLGFALVEDEVVDDVVEVLSAGTG